MIEDKSNKPFTIKPLICNDCKKEINVPDETIGFHLTSTDVIPSINSKTYTLCVNCYVEKLKSL